MKECPICQKQLPSNKSLASHRRKVHKIVNPLVCCVITRAQITVAQLEKRNYQTCAADDCDRVFVSFCNAKFCCQSCSGRSNNRGRVRSASSKAKTATALKSYYSKPIDINCIGCGETFIARSSSALRCRSCKPKYLKPRARKPDQKRASPQLHSKSCQNCGIDFEGVKVQKFCSKKCCYDNSVKGKEFAGMVGGYRPRAGRGHYGYYNGIWCDSTWEMAYIWHCQTTGSEIVRNTVSFPYVNQNGEARKYVPDFLVDGHFTEVKGWMRPDDPYKFAAFPYPLNVVTGAEIKRIVKEAQLHFGTTLLETLFSERPVVKKNCLYCGTEFQITTQKKKKYCDNSCASKHQNAMVIPVGDAPTFPA